ncbi:MAG: PQQ-binding-like beta-propeller repeat protein [Bryobacteraceae bacterium]
MRNSVAAAVAVCFVGSLSGGEWHTFGGNPQRTGWAKDETKITKENVRGMKLQWKAKLDNEFKDLNSLTVPVVAINLPTLKGFKDIVIVAGASDNVFGLDADDGKVLWSKRMQIEGTPKNPAGGWLCPNALNATPVIDKKARTVYVLASDGKLHSFNFINGEDIAPPVQFTPPFAKTWSLNLVNGTLYTTISQGCNGVRSSVYAMDLNDPKRPVSMFQSSPSGGAGIWGRAGAPITSAGTIVAETGDGAYDAAAGKFPDTFLGLSSKDLKLVDYYTPANRAWITKKDLDMGNMSAVVFPFKQWELVAGAGKEGVIFLLDAKSLGGADHRTPLFRSPLYANDDADFASRGFWGAMAAYTDAKNATWLLAPAWGPPAAGAPAFAATNGPAQGGSIMAFQLDEKDGKPVLVPAWRSRDMEMPEPPVVANGVVFAVSSGENTRQVDSGGRLLTSKERASTPVGNATLYALDAETGKELFSSGKTMPSFTHFSGLAISEGRVYVVTHDSTLYAFGVPD